jgi:hypothetical protein
VDQEILCTLSNQSTPKPHHPPPSTSSSHTANGIEKKSDEVHVSAVNITVVSDSPFVNSGVNGINEGTQNDIHDKHDNHRGDNPAGRLITHIVGNANNNDRPNHKSGKNSSRINPVKQSKANSYLKVGHLNVQSLMAHIHEARRYMIDHDPDILAVTETWLRSSVSSSNIKIEGYQFVRHDRTGRSKKSGGGLGFYIRSNLKFVILQRSINSDQQGVELMWIEIQSNGEKSLVGVCYRPPDIPYAQLAAVESSLHDLSGAYHHIILLGDFNVNWNCNGHDKILLSSMADTFSLKQIVVDPTHTSVSTATLIDLVFVSDPDLVHSYQQHQVPSISHHDLILFHYHIPKPKHQPKFILSRNLKQLNSPEYKSELQTQDWASVFTAEDIDSKLERFNSLLMSVINKHAPLRKFRVTRPPAPWLNDEIRASEKIRDNIFSKHRSELLQTPGMHKEGTRYWNDYKIARNAVNSLIRRAKTQYYKSALDENYKKPKLLWKNLDYLDIHKPKGFSSDITSNFSAEALNTQFLKVFNSAPAAPSDLSSFSNLNNLNLEETEPFALSVINEKDIVNYIKNIKTNARGVDDINLTMLRASLPHIASPILHIINFCICNSVFPSQWKQSVIRPIPKVDRPAITDFRPISILPVLSKILERAVHNQVSAYLDKNELLDINQSGFRKGHSTATALGKITNDIFSNMNNGEVTCSVLLDFSKAFDLVNHSVLLHKLHYFNFSDPAIQFFKSYLSDRSQSVSLGNGQSPWAPVTVGVPQGSILGPLLFTLYINDLSRCLKVCSYHLYADDLQIYMPGKIKDINSVIDLVNEDLVLVWNWAALNLLMLNPDKTQSILFGTNRLLSKLPLLINTIKLNDKPICFLPKVKNLGLMMDQHLNWDKHISHVCSSVYLKLRNLHRHKNFLTVEMRKRLFQSLILPVFDYCDTIYASTTSANKLRVRKSFNSCIRFVTGLKKFDHVSQSIQNLNLLTPENRQALHLSCMTHKVLQSNQPAYLKSELTFLSDSHEHNTRNDHTLKIPIHKLEHFKNSLKYNCISTWNDLPLQLRGTDSSVKFLEMAKTYWFDKQSVMNIA